MHYAIYLFGIIQMFQLFIIIKCQCPEYFRYFRNETTGEIMGTVEIPNPPQGVPLHLRVILSVSTILPTKYVGRLELVKSREESIRNVLQGLPLFYQIYFPVRNPIPVIISITLNGVQYCSGQSVSGVIVTNIILEHTLYPPRVIIPLTEQLLNFISNQTNASTSALNSDLHTDKRSTLMPDKMETLPTSTLSNLQFTHSFNRRPIDSSCGLISESSPLVTSEKKTLSTTWPWLAAIFFMKDKLEFRCAGNLLSSQYVLTVANCLIEDDENVSSNMLLVSLGRYNLQDWKEPNTVNVDVIDYKIHPDYKNSESADADLAIIKLMKRVEYTPTIRPICLWMGKVELDTIVDRSGYVIGWGSDEKNTRYSAKPRLSEVPIVSQENCLRSNIGFIEVTSNRTFCAGKRDGSGPCDGDRGSGFIMFNARYNRYHLRGIVSLSLLDLRTRSCDLKEYVVYVDIAKYLTWINEILSFNL